jgi:uncharacterized membrane protein
MASALKSIFSTPDRLLALVCCTFCIPSCIAAEADTDSDRVFSRSLPNIEEIQSGAIDTLSKEFVECISM